MLLNLNCKLITKCENATTYNEGKLQAHIEHCLFTPVLPAPKDAMKENSCWWIRYWLVHKWVPLHLKLSVEYDLSWILGSTVNFQHWASVTTNDPSLKWKQNLQGSLEPIHRPAGDMKTFISTRVEDLPYTNSLKPYIPELQHACQHQAD